MKLVVNGVSAIIDDVAAFERLPSRDRQDVDVDVLRNLQERAEATLSNLVVASKTHATSSGMSPVSLLDAAASHVSACVTDIGRTVAIRKATKAEQDGFASSSPARQATSPVNGFSPSLKSVVETRSSPAPLRNGGSMTTNNRTLPSKPSPSTSRYQASSSPVERRQPPSSSERRLPARPPSDNSSERTNSPPAIFDQPNGGGGVTSDESVGSGEGWTEVKVRISRFALTLRK